MRKSSGYLVLFVGVAALVGAGVWLGSDPARAADEAGRPPYVLPVTLADVRRDTVSPTVELTGTVRSTRWARASFEIGGVLATLSVEEGDAVAAGAVLARLDDTDEKLAVQQANDNLTVATRRLDLLNAGERGEVKRRLEAELEVARAQEQLAVLEVDRRRELAAVDDVSQAEMDRVQADRRAAVARREAAEQSLAEANAGAREEDKLIAQAQVDVAKTALETAQRSLTKTALLAPWEGTVVRRHVSVGDHLAPGETVVELADLRHLEIVVEVPSRFALRLGSSPRILVHVDEVPDFVYDTRLTVTIPAADIASRNFRGIVRVDTVTVGRDVLRPGMFVRLSLHLADLENAIVVPSDAVRTTEDATLVVRAVPAPDGGDGLVGELVPVRVLGSDAGSTAVEPISGKLAPGDRVVMTGVDLAYPGVALLPRDEGADGASESAP
ncbi:MAG: efflux RND transporter periplasmic adaptor subunit [Planctomycetes bacterium]|nr:efflux RND transporter periplasmic adaptor subunit [Planctomycetota bacterium]